MRKSKTTQMILVAMLAAVAVVLQYVGLPILPMFSFLKLDFSDIPILIGMFLFGPMAGIAIACLRSFLHLFTTGLAPQNIVGDVASLLASLAFTLPLYYFFQRSIGRFPIKFWGMIVSTAALTIFMSVANYFVITPIYLQLFGVSAQEYLNMSLAKYVAIGIVPFNLLKGIIINAIFFIIHARMLPWIHQKRSQSSQHSA